MHGDGLKPGMDYNDFLKRKVRIADRHGFDVDESEINPILKPHQRTIVKWAIAGGCRALFEAFGLGKTVQELEICRLILKKLDKGIRWNRHIGH
jgi:hypothetical protein